MRIIMAILVALLVAIVVVGLRTNEPKPAATNSTPIVDRPSRMPQAHSHMDYAAKGRVPAYYETAPKAGVLGTTLSPELFTGNIRLAYLAAKEIPQTLAQLPCYCHCDRGHGHNSLHSCFESEHGENCGICIGEAVMAHNLQRRGVSVSEIRKRIIAAYGQRQ